jgi:hypothetical protein
VTDGSPAASDTKSFTVVVNEVNSPPVFALIGDKTIREGNTLSFLVSAVDPDLPANIVTYSLESAPAGVTLNPTSGQFTWTPTPAQGRARTPSSFARSITPLHRWTTSRSSE